MAGKKKSDDRQDEPSQEFQNFQQLLKGTLSVPKEELDRRRNEHDQARARGKEGGD